MDQFKESLSANYFRRFGAEIEINAFDGRNRPVGYEDGALPSGAFEVSSIINQSCNEKVVVHKWGHDHHNDSWVVKPDGSCGLEVCTPVMKGYHGLNRLCKAVSGMKKHPVVKADNRCSFHVHIDVSDMSERQVANIVAWWIKCEPVFIDSVPSHRKKNHYCQYIGITDIFDSLDVDLENTIRKLGNCKYYTINTYHYYNEKRKTIEIRIMDNHCCLDAWMAKNWIRLLLHFVEQAASKPVQEIYEKGNQWSGYCWLDPLDVYEFLGFLPEQSNLSPGLEQTRSWFTTRLKENCQNPNLTGFLGSNSRKIAIQQIIDLHKKLIPLNYSVTENDIFNDYFRV